MKKSRRLIILILIFIAFLETSFVGCGGGGSNSFDEVRQSAKKPDYKNVPVNDNGSISQRFSYDSSAIYISAEEDTVSNDAKITLTQRAPYPNESKEFGNLCSNVYKLDAVTEKGESLLTSQVNIEKTKKPIRLEIVQKFPDNIVNFFMGTRSSSEADWQYTKLQRDGYASYSNTNSFDNLANSYRAVSVATVSYTFTINTTTFGDEIAVFGESPASSTVVPINSVSRMEFTTDLPYLDLKYDSNENLVYNTDLVINSCIEAERLGSLFSDATVQTIITFLTPNGTTIENLRVVGNSTAFATQNVSQDGGGAGDQYTHTIYFKDYTNPSKSGRLATYSFTLKTRNVLLDEFPATFTIKTILVDNTIPIAYASEAILEREKLLSFLSPISPTSGGAKSDIGVNLVMKYIAHDIASVTVRYTYPGAENSLIMPGSFSVDLDNHLITFSPDNPWPSETTVSASATASCCGEHEPNGIRTAFFKFETKEVGSGSVIIGSTTYDPVTISMIEPDPATNVATDAQIVLQFSDDVEWLASFSTYLRLSSGTHPVGLNEPTFDNGARTITFAPEEGFKCNSSYTLYVDPFTDTINHKLVSNASFSISTCDGVHAQASIIASDGSIIDGRYITNPIFIVDFGKDITKSDYINENRIAQAFNSIKVYQNDSLLQGGKVSKNWITPYQYMQLTFTAPLEASSTYKIVMGEGVLDFENIAIDPFEPYIFTTIPDVTAELAVPASPIDVDINTELVLQFSGEVDWIASFSKSFNLFIGKAEIPLASYTYDPTAYTLTMLPEEPLLYNSSYTLLIAPGLINPSTKQSIASNAFYFATCDGPHYNSSIIVATDSIHDDRTIIKPTLIVDFGDRVLNYNAARAAVRIKKNGVEISFTPFIEWQEGYRKVALTYTLEPDTTYTVTLDEGVQTFKGNLVDPFDEFTFTTAADITTEVTTPDSSTGVATSSKIVFTFSDDIAWSGSAEDKQLFCFYRGLTNVTSTIRSFDYATAARTLTLTPSSMFYNASYTVQLDDGLVNQLTGQKVATCSFYFETGDGEHAVASVSFKAESLIEDKSILTPTIIIDYTKPVMNFSLANDNIKLYKGDTLVSGYSRQWNADKSKVNLVFSSPLAPNTEYTLKMINETKDYEGIVIDPFDDFVFTTIDNITASLTTPADLNNVASSTKLVITFSDSITWNQEEDADKVPLKLDGQDVDIRNYLYSDADKTLTLTPKKPLIHNATYSLRINAWLKNNTTGQKVATTTFTFVTADGDHNQASIALATDSVVADKVILQPTLIIDFHKDLLNADVTKVKDVIKVFKGSTEVKTVYKTWDREYNKLKLTFSTNLESSQNYKVTMGEGIRDVEGIFIDPFDDFEFTTQDEIDFALTTPADTENVATSTKIIFTFSSPIDWKDSYKNKFTLKIGDTVLGIESFTYNEDAHTLTLTPSEKLLYNTTYTIAVRAGIKNETTQQMTTKKTFEFTTMDGEHSSAILIVSDEDKVDGMFIVTPTFVVDFGKTVMDRNAAENAIELYKGTEEITTLTKTWLTAKRQLQITCDSMLTSKTEYKVSMQSGVKDSEGSNIEPFEDFYFTTTPNGTGTERDPYLIYTASQLDNMRKNLNAFYKLKKDINIATSSYKSDNNPDDYGWLPIGKTTSRFAGGLDGDGHTISGLSINRPTTDSVGLFGQIDTAKIKNIYMTDGIVIGEDSCGGLIGYAYNSEITNCCNESVKVKGVSHVGGISGEIYSTMATKLRNSGTIIGSGNRTGGIVGWNNIYSTISSCFNNGSVTGSTEHVGGIAGYNNASVNNCANNATISGYQYVGGIVGSNNASGKVNRCIAVGNMITGNLASVNVGGIGGYNDSSAKIMNSVITNNTYINGYPCNDNSQVVFNYDEGTNENCNYYFGSVTDLNNGISDPAKWTDSDCWNSLIWRLSAEGIPTLVDIP